MIHIAINHIADQLNQHLKHNSGLDTDIVVTSNLIELDGRVPPKIGNKIVISLVNLERDTVAHPANREITGGDRQLRKVEPLYLNIYLMIAGHFAGRNYSEALKFLSTTIAFFQRKPILDHVTTPDMDKRIERLTIEIANLEFQELSNLWSIIGGKYLPSILYKIRMVAIDNDDVIAQTPTLREPVSEVAQHSHADQSSDERDQQQEKWNNPA